MIEIINRALAFIGEQRIPSLDDNTNTALIVRDMFDISLGSILSAFDWNFARKRAILPKLADPPLFDYSAAYELPDDFLKLIKLNDYVFIDLNLFNLDNKPHYTIENNKILLISSTPTIKIVYTSFVKDSSLYPPPFKDAFAARLAMDLAEKITGSANSLGRQAERYQEAIRAAKKADMIQRPPQKISDDSWVLGRVL